MLDILQRLPLRQWKRVKAWVRYQYATVEWPDDVPHVRVPNDRDVIEGTLREAHFEDASGWSLRYDGELLNLRRPAGVADDGMPLEDHLRFRPTEDDSLEGNGHREPSRWEAKTAHVNGEGLEWFSASQLAGLLEDAGLPGDVIESVEED